MSTPRKFYKNRIIVEVLSEDEPLDSNLDMTEVVHAYTEGDCSGQVTWEDPVLLTPAEAAKALEDQGSDPSFFQLTSDGKEADDDNEEEFPPAEENAGRRRD